MGRNGAASSVSAAQHEADEEQQMINAFRDCPGCGHSREFAQLHPDPERCPDVPGGRCPEWFCTACGSSLLIDLAPPAGGSIGTLDRVA
jgi:hypothetical protein